MTLPTLGKHQTSMDHKNESDQGSNSDDIRRTLTTVTLSPEQFEMLYLQPRDARRSYPLAGTFGNPTPLGISSFLVAHVPLALDLLNLRGATAASSVAMLGAFYACAGIGLYLACIMEWIIGNTFPSVVFGTFGGFFISYAIINQPTMGIAASFAPAADATNGVTASLAGASTPAYNTGLAFYFVIWGVLTFSFFLASLRTNAVFVLLFIAITMVFELIAAGYFHASAGNLAAAAMDFKVAGGFALVSGLAGFYVNFSLLFASVGYPFVLPLYDLSTRFMAPKDLEKNA